MSIVAAAKGTEPPLRAASALAAQPDAVQASPATGAQPVRRRVWLPISVGVHVHTLDSLRYRNFRLQWVSTLGGGGSAWVSEIVIGWLTYDLTRSPLLTSLALGLGALPYLLASPLGGILADTLDRRKFLAVTALIQAAFAGVFAAVVISGRTDTWHIFAFVLVMGLSGAVSDPARLAIIPAIVRRQDLMNAIALDGLASHVMGLVAPAIAGLMITLAGPGQTLLLQVALYLLVCAATLSLRLDRAEPREVPRRSPFTQIAEGGRYMMGEPTVMALTVLGAIPLLLLIPFVWGLMPVYASEVFHAGPAALGLLMSALGVGAMLATVALASVGDLRHKGRVLVLSLALALAAMVAFSRIGSVMPALPILVVLGGALTTFFTVGATTIQALVPDQLRGRIWSLGLMTMGIYPVGTLLSGGLAGTLGAPHATLIGAGAMGLLVMALLLRFRGLWSFN